MHLLKPLAEVVCVMQEVMQDNVQHYLLVTCVCM